MDAHLRSNKFQSRYSTAKSGKQQPGMPSWQKKLAEAIRDPEELVRILRLDPGLLMAAGKAAAHFPLRVPRDFVELMEPGNPADPLLLQVLPLLAELQQHPDYCNDAVGDNAALKAPGLLHKYHGRVLLIVTPACAIHCRYCFRREFDYQQAREDTPDWQAALDYIRNDNSISEVILSGGDPLVQSDRRLRILIEQLATIPHLRRLRIHSRLPVVLPDRMTSDLLQLLSSDRFDTSLVIHANHPAELSDAVCTALQRCHAAGITLLNQSVLLNGINNDIDTLTELSEKLFHNHTLPYYLHLPDRVTGTRHFDVSEAAGRELTRKMSGILPGYLVPKLVREIAGEPAKTGIC